MVTEGEINPTVKLFPPERAPLVVDIMAQGGGRRGAATAGFLFGLTRFEDIKIEAMSGTSAGAMATAVLAHGLSKEATDPTHTRQDTRLLQAKLYNTITEYSPWNVAQSAVVQAQTVTKQAYDALKHGRRIWLNTPFAALSPTDFIHDLESLGNEIADVGLGIGAQFSLYSKALTRAIRVQHGRTHILHLLLQDTIGNTNAITHPAAPLLVANAVRLEDERHLLFHNRQPMSLPHIVASAALSAYLPTIHVPGVGQCRDGAEGGANPPLLDFYRLKQEILPNAQAKIGILYNLSDPDGSLKAELAARDPKLHAHFIAAMARQQAERAALSASGKDLRVIQAALTPAQRAESLSDTDPAKMRAMFKIGQQQGEALGWQLLSEAFGHDVRPRPRHRPAHSRARAAVATIRP